MSVDGQGPCGHGDYIPVHVVASYWLKNVTNNSKIAPKSNQGANGVAILRNVSSP